MTESVSETPVEAPTLTTRQRMFRRLIGGVLFVMPAVITVAVVYQIFLMVHRWIIAPVTLFIIPRHFEDDYLNGWWLVTPFISLFAVFGILYLAGYLFQTRLRNWLNWLFSNVPGISTIYVAIMDVLYAYQGPDGLKKIDKVVLVPFPHERARAAGYLMSRSQDIETGDELVCVYIPLCLFPPSGYTLIYRSEDVIITDWEATDGWKILLSAGLTLPEKLPYRMPAPHTSKVVAKDS
ncbi:MAG TPA: hypothetical protein DD473_16510 [Planctomycetaceae bacterium]|nr:hypothetical protein [Planctomycetaceae bacterium]